MTARARTRRRSASDRALTRDEDSSRRPASPVMARWVTRRSVCYTPDTTICETAMSDEFTPRDVLRQMTEKLESAMSFRRALETEKDEGYYLRALEDYDRRIEVLRLRRRQLIERH